MSTGPELPEDRPITFDMPASQRMLVTQDPNIYVAIFTTTVDRARLCLKEATERIARGNAWQAPAGILVTLLAALGTAPFRDLGFVSGGMVEAVFWVAAVLVAYLMVKAIWLRHRNKAPSVDQIIEQLRGDTPFRRPQRIEEAMPRSQEGPVAVHEPAGTCRKGDGSMLAPAQRSSWIAREKRWFFPRGQQADALLIHQGGSPPARIDFACSSDDSYWRAGVILANAQYNLQHNAITDALLIHVGRQPRDPKSELWVYLSGTAPLERLPIETVDRYSVRIDLHHEQNALTIRINNLAPRRFEGIETRKWSERAFLAAWADGQDFTVVFEEIAVRI